MELVGKAVKKTFQGLGTFDGIVDSYDPSSCYFKVLYEDGDSEELELGEVVSILQEPEQSSLQIEARRRGRKRKERDPGNFMDTQMRESGFQESVLETLDASFDGGSQDNRNGDFIEIQNKGFDLAIAVEDTGVEGNGSSRETASSGTMEGAQKKQSGFVVDCDGDGSFNGDYGENDFSGFVLETQMKCGDYDGVLGENCSSDAAEATKMKESGIGGDCNVSSSFDGNLMEKGISGVIEVDREPKGSGSLWVMKKRKEDGDFDGRLKENNSFGDIEDSEMKDRESDEFQAKVSGSGAALIETPKLDGGFVSLGTEEHGRWKRRKLSEKLKSAPERALRRSARRTSAALLSSPNPFSDTDKLPGMDNVPDERCVVSDSREFEERNNLPLKPALPPSSNNLNIDELPILDLFSVYACLRSFSTVLFLTPFGLEAFVKALKCNYANSLIDSIHFSILHALKLHLEFLSNEGSQSASDCLRYISFPSSYDELYGFDAL